MQNKKYIRENLKKIINVYSFYHAVRMILRYGKGRTTDPILTTFLSQQIIKMLNFNVVVNNLMW